MRSLNSGMVTVHLGNILDVFTVLSFVLALYSLVLSLWFANLTIIAVLLFFLLKGPSQPHLCLHAIIFYSEPVETKENHCKTTQDNPTYLQEHTLQ